MKNKHLTSRLVFILIVFIIFIFFATIMLYFYLYNNYQNELKSQEIIIDYTDYDYNKLVGVTILYYEDDKYTSEFGIDVSSHQDKIDWALVKKSGVDFAFIRLGYRGATLGQLNIDPEFSRNYAEATKQGIKVGVYFFSQANGIEEAKQEAQFVKNVLYNRDLQLPVVYDLEEAYTGNLPSRIGELTSYQRSLNALTFFKEFENTKYDTMLYTNLTWADEKYDWRFLHGYDVWFAQYSKKPQFDKPFKFWQYSESGYINGIDGKVDFDLRFIRKNDQN